MILGFPIMMITIMLVIVPLIVAMTMTLIIHLVQSK